MPGHPSPLANNLLGRLHAEEQAQLFSQLELTVLTSGSVLHEFNAPLAYVYFPTDAVIALQYIMTDGESTGVALIGHEGLSGIALLLGGDRSLSQAVVQNGGHAYRLARHNLLAALQRYPGLKHNALNYVQALFSQIAQTAVCNRHHTVDQQLCRWLLLTLDRLPDNHLHLTHEFIAKMLGVRREGVSEAAAKLQKLAIIEYHRGHITVMARKKLEDRCCECYQVVKSETGRLLGVTPLSSGESTSRRVQWNADSPTIIS